MTDIVRNAPALNRFEIYDGDEIAGFAEYVDHDRQRIFHHTEIGERFGGKGLGGNLIQTALTETSNAGMRYVPYARSYRRSSKGTTSSPPAPTR